MPGFWQVVMSDVSGLLLRVPVLALGRHVPGEY